MKKNGLPSILMFVLPLITHSPSSSLQAIITDPQTIYQEQQRIQAENDEKKRVERGVEDQYYETRRLDNYRQDQKVNNQAYQNKLYENQLQERQLEDARYQRKLDDRRYERK